MSPPGDPGGHLGTLWAPFWIIFDVLVLLFEAWLYFDAFWSQPAHERHKSDKNIEKIAEASKKNNTRKKYRLKILLVKLD